MQNLTIETVVNGKRHVMLADEFCFVSRERIASTVKWLLETNLKRNFPESEIEVSLGWSEQPEEVK